MSRRGGLLRSAGPGAIVAAAFIGPGTVTTATLAGARFGYDLLWALAFSILATLVLQEMAARLGLVTGRGLGEAVRRRFEGPAARFVAIGLIVAAVAFGNAAYQTGNLLGAALGAEVVAGGVIRFWALAIAVVAFILLWTGSYRVLERFLVGIVLLMSVAFLATAIMIAPPMAPMLRGLLVPTLPGPDAILVAIALVGTTVVPYNLFLHSAAVREKWGGPESLRAARLDLGIAIIGGGVVSMAIVATSASLQNGAEIAGAGDMAVQLEPLLGRAARIFFGVGFLAAGLTSAITAPLAAAYATAGAFGWPRDLRLPRVRAVWMIVLGVGLGFAMAGVRPVPAILLAQVANGIMLPGVALFLLLAANDRRWMGRYANGLVLNAIGAIVVLITFLLGARAFLLGVRALAGEFS